MALTMVKQERKFYEALQSVFIGAKIEGEGGFINLMRIKSNYYLKIEKILKDDIEQALAKHPAFRDDLFNKLYSFFNRYFTQSGSIYFNSTPFHNDVYEKVYTDDSDVIMFWKTQMLYYVKTDRVYRSLPIEFEGQRFFFDATEIKNKQNNEKRALVFTFKTIQEEDNAIVIGVQRSQNGGLTNKDEILRAISRRGFSLSEAELARAIAIFERQAEVDFFINKNAKAFLQEQFKLWSYQYFWEGSKDWSAQRIDQLQILKDIAFKIIDFIAQFEDELLRVWNKPKFVKNSNYVITLDKITNHKLIEKIKNHKNFAAQLREWDELSIAHDNAKAPVDTKYFKDLELDIIGQFEDLDKALDGWLIKSENYQALNTILPKFKSKVQMIFIDPPFNKAESSQFAYIANYLTSSWISLVENRLGLAKLLLNETGTIFVNSDDKCNSYTRILLDYVFKNFQNEIIWAYEKPGAGSGKFKNNHSNIYFYSRNEKFVFNTLYVPRKGEKGLTPKKGKYGVDYSGKKSPDWWVDMWDDIPSFATMQVANERISRMLGIQFPTQLPEKLLYRVIHTGSNKGDDLVVDFFAGTGVTAAVAHKMGRKWINIESGDQFDSIIVPRMKKVLAYDESGVTKDVQGYQGGGFFKYYELEQYEEALANCKYQDSDLFMVPGRSPYQEYVFMKDAKLLATLEIDYERDKVKVDLSKLYAGVDVAETLSNLTGKWIKTITASAVEFEDGSKTALEDLDYKQIKPLIWWE